MNQEQLKEKIKDFKQKFAVGGWLNENINVVFVETWLIFNFLTKEAPKKSPIKVTSPKEQPPKVGATDNLNEVKQEVSEVKSSEPLENTLPVE